MITSANNAKVKRIVRLNTKTKARAEEGCFVAEGRKLFQETPEKLRQEVYVSSSFLKEDENRALLEKAGTSFEEVTDSVFEKMSDTKTPQGILTVAAMPVYKREDLLRGYGAAIAEDGTENSVSTGFLAEKDEHRKTENTRKVPLVLLLENVQDPGNVGTIIRTAEGAGVTGIFLSTHSADCFQPKAIRSTMGSIYRVPVRREENLTETARWLKEQGITIFAAHLAGRNAYTEEDYRKGTAFLIGNEGNGLTEELARMADIRIRIPMEGKVESLNAAVASALLMYEAHRQREITA